MGINIWKKIEILSTEILAIVICIQKSKLSAICFSANTTRHTKSPPQSHLALKKCSSTKSCWMFYSKVMTVGLSVATIYDVIPSFVWLPWQPFKSRTLISWGLFVTTTRKNPELLVHHHIGKSIVEDLHEFDLISSLWIKLSRKCQINSNITVIFWINGQNASKMSH